MAIASPATLFIFRALAPAATDAVVTETSAMVVAPRGSVGPGDALEIEEALHPLGEFVGDRAHHDALAVAVVGAQEQAHGVADAVGHVGLGRAVAGRPDHLDCVGPA